MQEKLHQASLRQAGRRSPKGPASVFSVFLLPSPVSTVSVDCQLSKDENMKNKKPNAEQVCKQIEDFVVPRLRLSPIDRAVYFHLLRHSRFEGRVRIRFSIPWLAKGAGLSHPPVRWAVRRLAARGVLRLVERGNTGHLVEVRVPEEIRAAGIGRMARRPLSRRRIDDLEGLDFWKHRALRRAIHAREGGRCFYCQRPLTRFMRCLDHVVPRVEVEDNSYRNLVSCCVDCNSLKRGRPGKDFVRCLHREGRMSAAKLADRLRTLDALASGKLRPPAAGRGHMANPL
jgi:hypothetical protein